MMNRSAKAAFYAICSPLMKINGILYRWLRAPKNRHLRVQLGPGRSNYLTGWINIDANMFTGKCDVWADLRNPLPFAENSIEAFYSHHVVEHLPSLRNHFQEVFRCLRPGGVYRLGAPNGDSAIRKFVENDISWFSEFPDKRCSIGGRFENFIFCRGEHLTVITFSFCEELMSEIGFTNIRRYLPAKETAFPDIFLCCLQKEWESDFESPHTLVIEAEKPKS